MRGGFLLIISIFLILAFSSPNLSAEEFNTNGLPLKIEGEKVDYFIKDELVIAIDKASIEYEDIKIFADRIEINVDTEEIKAINNVYYLKNENTVEADYLFYNFKEEKGVFTGNIKGYFPPWHWTGDRIEAVAKDEFILSRGAFTTCGHERPHYHLSCSSATIKMEEKATAKNMFFHIGTIPIFYFPYYYTYLKYTPYGLVNWVGHSDEKGWMDLAHYNWYVNDDFRGRIYVDYLENIGWGQGFDIDLKTEGGKNYIYGYYMDEKSGFYGTDDIKRHGGTAEGNDKYKRWKGVFKHKQIWQNDWMSMMKIERFSDENFNKDFRFEEINKGEDSFALGRAPENYFAFEQIKPDYNTILYTNAALNDFEYLVQRQPSISFSTREQPIKNSPLYYKFETNYTHLKEAFPEEEDIDEDTELDRFDLSGKLSTPHKINNWVTSEPYVTFRGTGYSKDKEEDAVFRTTESVGWNLRSKLAKQYGNFQHIFQPQIGYYYRPDPSITKHDLIGLDPIDRITSQNGFFVEFVNRLKTPRYKETPDIEYLPKNAVATYFRDGSGEESLIPPSIIADEISYREPLNFRVFSNYSAKEERWEHVFMENTFRPINGISLVSDATYTPQKDLFEIVNSSLGISKWERVGGSLGLSYYRGEDLYRGNGSIWFNFPSNIFIRLAATYDIENDFLRSSGVYIKKDLHCWTAELQLNNYKRTRSEDYTFEIFLAFSLTDLSGFKLPLSGTITPRADDY